MHSCSPVVRTKLKPVPWSPTPKPGHPVPVEAVPRVREAPEDRERSRSTPRLEAPARARTPRAAVTSAMTPIARRACAKTAAVRVQRVAAAQNVAPWSRVRASVRVPPTGRRRACRPAHAITIPESARSTRRSCAWGATARHNAAASNGAPSLSEDERHAASSDAVLAPAASHIPCHTTRPHAGRAAP